MSALCGGEWVASGSGRFTNGKTASSSHLRGCWVGLKTDLYKNMF